MEEFSSKPPVNPNLPAAGKGNTLTKSYSVIEHRYVWELLLHWLSMLFCIDAVLIVRMRAQGVRRDCRVSYNKGTISRT